MFIESLYLLPQFSSDISAEPIYPEVNKLTEEEEKKFLREVRKMIRENRDLEVALSKLG